MPETNFLSLLAGATLVVQCVLGLLVAMSLTSWSIIFMKIFLLGRARREAEQDLTAFIQASTLRAAIKTLGANASAPCYQVALQGVNELNRFEDMEDTVQTEHGAQIMMDNVRRALRRGVGSQVRRMTRSLSFLATCANAAPFIGLFGTVWGIMHSFHAIGQMKTASLAAVAPGISEALIATAIGLAVAIPATIAYNFFLSKVNQIENELINFAGAFLNRVQREMPGLVAGTKSGSDEF
ncbi:MAG: protein TolQ [Desulfovibrionaceae bacterium]